MDELNEILTQALRLKAAGFSLIPIDPATKKPLIGWQYYQTKQATEHEIEGWIKQWPNMGIAIVTGKISKLVVFDIDPRNGGTDELFKEYKTVKVKTGGGGWHYYFKQPDKTIGCIPNLMTGIDVKGQGGYVICPPSGHPSGNRYEWLMDEEKPKVMELPDKLLELVTGKRPDAPTTGFDASIVQGVGAGTRNISAAQYIGKIIRGLRLDEMEAVGWETTQAWNTRNEPPIDSKELRTTFESILKNELKKRGQDSDIDIWTTDTLYNISDNENIWVVDKLFPVGCTLMSGPPKSYKTYMTWEIAKSIVRSEPLFGKFAVRESGNVLIWDRENSPRLIKRRIKQLGIRNDEPIYWMQDLADIAGGDFKKKLFIRLEELNISYIIFDSFRRFLAGDENSSEEVAKFFQFISEIKELSISSLILHHDKKPPEKAWQVADEDMIRGSSDLVAYPDSILKIKKMVDGSEVVIKISQPALRVEEETSPFTLSIVSDKENNTVEFKFRDQLLNELEKPQECRKAILENLEFKGYFYVSEISEKLKGSFGKSLIVKELGRMVEDEILQYQVEGKKKVYTKKQNFSQEQMV